MRSFLQVTGVVLLAGGLLLSGCGNNNDGNDAGGGNANQNEAKKPAPGKQKGDFPIWGYDYQQTRHVPYNKITKDNVKKLGVVWQKDLTDWDKSVENAQEDHPVVKNGVLYVTTANNYVFAIDGATGKKKWQWKPSEKVLNHMKGGKFRDIVASRGLAVANGNVFVLLGDNRLAKLDAETGKLKKMVNIWDSMDELKNVKLENRYYEAAAPMYYKGNVYVGSSGGDNASRGFVMAFKASNLKPAWDHPFWTIPPQGKGWRKGEYTGGGSVWGQMSFDPETDMMYFGVGNPAPDFFDEGRKGANPHVDSVVALDSKTGKKKWSASEMDHDIWDYDAVAAPMILNNAKVNGKRKKIVVQGGKNGKWYAWDAKTGKTIYNGVPFVKIKHSAQSTSKPKLQWPGVEGGENYTPETYDPNTNYVIIPGINKPSLSLAAKDREEISKNNNTFPGTKVLPTPPGTDVSGTVTAIDVNTGKKVWQKKTDDEMYGGITSTASGLAFYGELNGTVNAVDIKSGKVLWNMKSGGTQIKMAPAIYMADGKEYIVFITDGTKVVVYGLGGKDPSKMAPSKAKQGTAHGQEKAAADPKQIYKQNCASCHGANLEGGAGPNLQHVGKTMSKQDILNQIKNGSGRMPGGLVKGQQAQALADWLSKKK